MPVEQPVLHLVQRYLSVHLQRRDEDLGVFGVLRPHRLVHPGDELIEPARAHGEARGLVVAAPLAHQVPDGVEGPVEVDVRLPGPGRAAVRAVRPPIEDRRRPPRGPRYPAGHEPREPPGLVRDDYLEVLLGVYLLHRPLDGVAGTALALGVQAVELPGDAVRLPWVPREQQVEGGTGVLDPADGVQPGPEPPPEVLLV